MRVAIHEGYRGSEVTPELCFSPSGGRMKAINAEDGLSGGKMEEVFERRRSGATLWTPSNNHCSVQKPPQSYHW